jgi:hypothetical protein
MDIPCSATAFRNGTENVGNIHSSLPHTGVWELENYQDEVSTSVMHDELHEVLVSRWNAKVMHLTTCQAKSPWFEMRCGHLTGTTIKNVFRCWKFAVNEEMECEQVNKMYDTIGFNMERKNVDKATTAEIKKRTNCWDTQTRLRLKR